MPFRKGHTRVVKCSSKKSCIGKKTVHVKSTYSKPAKRSKKRK